ncbi:MULTISPECIES: DUF4124 domain-containing protein [Methylomonas]|uniref:DUF4124 domain-containing protein n=1 Tax=Methylomonas TaxID=416 RepID=UPI001232A191|nr:DUF4124 domain-containing protein [Methylomonas rhizoryzae]
MKVLITVLALAVAGQSSAGVYKCTDAEGHIDYRSSPCTKEDKAVQINTKTGSRVDLNAVESQHQREVRAEQQQHQEEMRAEKAQLDAIIQREQLAKQESELTQALIKQKPLQFSAFAIPPYQPGKLPALVKSFEQRLPDIEKYRRLAAEKALTSGNCQRVETDDLHGKSSLENLVFSISCSSGAVFMFNESELKQ